MMRLTVFAGILAVAGVLCPGDAHAMNKAELIDAIARESKLTKADAGRALDGFIHATATALQAGDKIALTGFGAFSVARRIARADGCGYGVEVDFVAGTGFLRGSNPLYADNGMGGENPLYVESARAAKDGSTAAYGWTDGYFRQGDRVLLLDAPDGAMVAVALVSGVIVLAADGSELVLDESGSDGETVGLLLRGIDKKDIRRGMVVAKPRQADNGEECPDEDAVMRDGEFILLMAKGAQLAEREVAAAFHALLDIVTFAVNSGETVDIGGLGSIYEAHEISVSAHEAAHVVQQRTGRNPQTGKEIKIAAKGLTDREAGLLAEMAQTRVRAGGGAPGGAEIKAEVKKVVKFKAGSELSDKVN